MRIQYEPDFIRILKKVDVRIRRSFQDRMRVFLKDPNDPQLNNHLLHKPYQGFRSIDITADYRALYRQVETEKDIIAYFEILGTHDELYGMPADS